MASSLVSQLAQIRAQGANPLDLKAQKKAHSQSLLFDAGVAGTQDFDTIFLLCNEGFQDLCRLDSRFAGFSKSIFSEQSKQADRTQMTTLQNSQLDKNLEKFLGMVGSKLLLKPALKAIEWLIRRFRVHENNTVYVVLTFLPYHTSSIFLTLLSLLPKTLPPILRFLHPYIESLALPPRHAIIYTASHNPKFFTTFNNHVLDLCRSGYHFPAICSFWATLTAESIAGMLEQSHSALHKVQKESQEDLMLRIMPVLNEGLVMEDVPDLQIGCYMILTILTTKVALSDTVLNAAMGAVISNWSQTTSAGLICLAALAQQRELVALPKKVLAALLALEKLVDDLNLLKTQYRVDNIALGVLLGVLERLERPVDEQHVDLVRSLLESELMEMSYITVAITTIISKLQKHGIPHDAKISLTNLLYSLAEDENLEAIIRNATKDNGSVLPQPKGEVQGLLTAGSNGDEPENEGATIETRRVIDAKAFQKAVGQIPEESSDETSFLAYSSSNTLFDYLSRLFILASSTTDQMEAFSHVPVLRKPLSRTHPVFLSFFIRFWCSGAPAIARAAAIHSVSDHLIQETPGQDMQILFPYVLYGLADPSVDVRRAATKLVLALGSVYRDRSKDANNSITKIFGQENIYGRAETPISTAWLSPEDAANFVELALLRDLEEALLDPTHISRHICDLLRGRRSSRTGQKELKSSARQAFFAFLCSHTINTSFYRVRYRLLQILCQMERVGALSRTKALLPLLLEYRDQAQEELNGRCIMEHIEPESLLEQVVEIVLPTDREGVQVLQAMVETEKEHPSRSLCYAANLRIRKMWPSMKQELQQSISISLFEYAVGERAFEGPESLMDEALETLRTAPLSTSILQALLDICLDLFKKLENDTYTPKRRRTNVGFTGSSSATLQNAKIILKRLTTTLELVEISKPEKHLELMKGLFQILAELQNSRSHFGTEMGYLQTLVLESIYAMVKEFERSTVSKIDKSAIRPDVIVESIRTAASAKVQHVALLLISGLATISPESVLHSVMPVFTFMGAGILRQNDDYSVYVVDRTMESVIPRLAVSLQKKKQDAMIGISEILLSFVAAFEHIPSQRRLGLFKSLADKLGASEYLFALLIILLDKHSGDRKTLEFAAELAGFYDVKTQFQTIEKYLSVICDMLQARPSISLYLVTVESRTHTALALAKLLPLTTLILKKKRLVSKTRELLNQEAESGASSRELYERVMELVFTLSGNLRHDRTLDALCQQVLDSLLGLPPISEFMRIIQRLLNHTKAEVCLDVLKSFQQRLNGNLIHEDATQKASLALLPQLSSILEQSTDLPLKQAVMASVDFVVKRFGKQDLFTTLAAAKIVSGAKILGVGDHVLQTAAWRCLATMVEVLKDMFTPLLPSLFPKSLDHLSTSLQGKRGDHRLHNAVYSFISALLSSTPWIFTDIYVEQLLSVSYESADSAFGNECYQTRSDTLRVLAKQVDPHLCFTALGRTWETAVNNGLTSVKEHLQVLRVTIEQQPKSLLVKHTSVLGGLFLEYFGLRCVQLLMNTEPNFTESEIEAIEQIVFETAITMIYKLNDATFRPMFRKILGWSNQSRSEANSMASLHRQTTIYSFLGIFFSDLKSIVTGYAALIIESSAKILQNIDPTDKKSIHLRKLVVTTLHKAFEHDQDGERIRDEKPGSTAVTDEGADFWQSPSHFSPIAEALLCQFDHAAEIPMFTDVIPALTELVVVADSTSHHKQLNSVILRYMRSDKAATRLAAVFCEHSLTDRLGEEWLAHLPEMLPFISELQEDDDEMVEQATHQWIRKIESILGESVAPMLQ